MHQKLNDKFIKFLMTLVVLIDFMGVAIVVVLFPNVFLDTHSTLFSSAWSPSDRLIALGLCLAIYPLGQFFGSSIFGKLSDTYGRKAILSWTIFGTFVGFILSATSMQIASFSLLFFSRLFTGLCAGNVAVAQASLVDISDENTKAKNLSLSQMAMGSAYVIGPVIGAILADSNLINWFGPSVPFWFFAGILAIEFVLLIIFYQDTRAQHMKVTINFLEGFQQIYNALTDKKLSNAFCVWFLFVCGWWLFESFMPAFLYEKFNFNTTNIGYLLGFNGALYAGFQYAVIQRIAHKISSQNMVIYSAPVTGLAIISMAYATNSFQLYTAMIIFVLSMGFCIPGLITSISNMAKQEEQGQVMGMIGSVQAMATVIVMSLGGYIHSLNINITIIAGGVLIVLSSVLFILKCLNNKPTRNNILMQAPERQ